MVNYEQFLLFSICLPLYSKFSTIFYFVIGQIQSHSFVCRVGWFYIATWNEQVQLGLCLACPKMSQLVVEPEQLGKR